MSTPFAGLTVAALPIMRFSERERLASLCVETSRPKRAIPHVAAFLQTATGYGHMRLPVAITDFVAN